TTRSFSATTTARASTATRRVTRSGRRPPCASADAAVFVAFRQQRTRIALLQNREIQSEGCVVIVGRHVEPLRTQTKVSRGEEPEILSARVPRRPHGVRQPISHLFRFACF